MHSEVEHSDKCNRLLICHSVGNEREIFSSKLTFAFRVLDDLYSGTNSNVTILSLVLYSVPYFDKPVGWIRQCSCPDSHFLYIVIIKCHSQLS